ncbi:beta-1,3-galactosyltransferase 1-like [Centruroides sculpturatus]|uniref:beta-1,3-galactosyltransferase 1-like n=1 Tax=Centruroides sculpturatus TaxID=218467 RepID=UPI000C6D0E7B|nr:beta-1,3-galactosyltransferase 1-like [Centruroides sculpturatus]
MTKFLHFFVILVSLNNSFQKEEMNSKTTKIFFRPLFIIVSFVIIWCVIYLPINSSRSHPPDTRWMLYNRDLHQYVLPENVTTILEPKLNCRNNSSKSLFLLVIVCSSVTNFAPRQAIRETWATAKVPETMKILFLLGKSENDTQNAAVMEENANYSDIIQENFLDTYNNLTVKSTMLLKWVNDSCRQAKYVMKTDDDMFVHLPNLVKFLKNSTQKHLLVGCLISGAVPIKDWHSKWYVPDNVYSEYTYPNYLSGTGYVMSDNIVSTLYNTALNTPLFYLEDIFITGICARKAGIKPVNNNGFKFYKRKNDPCIFQKIITSHKMTPSELREIWKKVNSPSIKCVRKRLATLKHRT